MKQYYLSLFSFFIVTAAQCQDSSNIRIKKQSPSYAILKSMDGSLYKGWLYKANTDEVFLIEKKKVLVPFAGMLYEKTRSSDLPRRFPVEQIEEISLRKKNAGLKGALIGLGVGAATGALIGFASGDDKPHSYSGNVNYSGISILIFTAREKATLGAFGLGVIGTITGLCIGNLVKKKFVIGGDKEKMLERHQLIMQRAMVQY